MRDILFAMMRAVRSLGQRGVLWHLVWPSVVAVVVWGIVAAFSWTAVVDAVVAWIQGFPLTRGFFSGSEVAAATLVFLVKLSLLLLLLPLIYGTAALLVAVIALPLILERVAARDYADLEQRRGGSNLGSAWNGVIAVGLFLVGLGLSLPFWLIPGVGLVVTVALTAWLNQKAFGYDALMIHADRGELTRLLRARRQQMLLLGGACALLAYIPFLNLVVPAFCGLAFVHLMLETLRRERAGQDVSVLDALPGAPS